jgi:hypothetical protein
MAEIGPYVACALIAVALTLAVFKIGSIRDSRLMTYAATVIMALNAIGGKITAPAPQYWADRVGIAVFAWLGIMTVVLMARGMTRIMADRRSAAVRR